MNIKFFLRKKDKFDATLYYIQVIANALEEKFVTRPVFIDTLACVDKDDVVVVISPQAYFKILLKNPRQKVVAWFQGISPEEISYLYSGFYNKLKVWLFARMERRMLQKNLLNFFVSQAMLLHYREKYGYKGENYVIMPCFNKQLNPDSFKDEARYSVPSFVYIGTASRWQCIEETIALFKMVKDRLPSAVLTILSRDREVIGSILERYNVQAEIKYVPLEQLDAELSKYKYGFILRNDICINRVATPTKLSSYLANGVIPVLSDVVSAFSFVSENKNFFIRADILKLDDATERICEFDKKKISLSGIYEEYLSVFDTFYNEKLYKDTIKELAGKYLY